MMSEIENREEMIAADAAYDAWASPVVAAHEQEAYTAGWIAGRDYQRAQAATDAEGFRSRVVQATVQLVTDNPEPGVWGRQRICILCGNGWDEDQAIRHTPSCLLADDNALTPAQPAGSEERGG